MSEDGRNPLLPSSAWEEHTDWRLSRVERLLHRLCQSTGNVRFMDEIRDAQLADLKAALRAENERLRNEYRRLEEMLR